MASDQWIFFTDLFGKQQWLRLSSLRDIVAESRGAFDNKHECVADARRHGYLEPRVSRPRFASSDDASDPPHDPETRNDATTSGSEYA